MQSVKGNVSRIIEHHREHISKRGLKSKVICHNIGYIHEQNQPYISMINIIEVSAKITSVVKTTM